MLERIKNEILGGDGSKPGKRTTSQLVFRTYPIKGPFYGVSTVHWDSPLSLCVATNERISPTVFDARGAVFTTFVQRDKGGITRWAFMESSSHPDQIEVLKTIMVARGGFVIPYLTTLLHFNDSAAQEALSVATSMIYETES